MGKAELYNYKIYSLEGFLKKLRFQSKGIKDCIREWAEYRTEDYINDPNYDFNFLVCYDGRSRDGNRFIGLLGIETSNKNKSCFYLSPLHVEEGYRHIGVGSKLIELSKNIARKNKYEEVSLYCEDKKLFKFYTEKGFRLNRYLEDKDTFELLCDTGQEEVIEPKEVSMEDYLESIFRKEIVLKKDVEGVLLEKASKGERFFVIDYKKTGIDSYTVSLSKSTLKYLNQMFLVFKNVEEIKEVLEPLRK